MNGLIEYPGPSWRTAQFSKQHQSRMALRRELYERENTRAIGFLDIARFFSSCNHVTAGSLLEAAGAPMSAVQPLIRMLGLLYPKGVGLPIGFEGSGPIANLFLDRVDKALDARGVQFVRWTDDIDVFLQHRSDWPWVLRLAEEELTAVGLQLNGAKTLVLDKGDAAERRLFDPTRASLFAQEDPASAAEDRLTLEVWLSEHVPGLVELG